MHQLLSTIVFKPKWLSIVILNFFNSGFRKLDVASVMKGTAAAVS